MAQPVLCCADKSTKKHWQNYQTCRENYLNFPKVSLGCAELCREF